MKTVDMDQLRNAQKQALTIHNNIQQLQELIACGTMDHAREMLEADIHEMEEKLRNLLYETHPYKINRSEQSQGKGKPKRIRWETYMGQGKPLMRANSLEELEEKLFTYYGLAQKLDPSIPHPHSLNGVYSDWLRERMNTASLSPQTWNRDVATYNKFIKGDFFANRDLNRITRKEAQEWLDTKAYDNKMDQKTAGRFKTLVNALEQYAFTNDLAKIKILSLLTISRRCLVRKRELQREEAIYLPNEIPVFVSTAWEKYKKLGSRYDSYLAAIFNHYFGMRVCEVVAIKWDDIDQDTNRLHLTRHEIELKRLTEDGNLCRDGWKTISGLKKGVPDRWLPLPSETWQLLNRIRTEHKNRGVPDDCPWIFVDQSGKEHIHTESVERAIQTINKVAVNGKNIFANKKGGNHEIRRTYASSLIDSNNISRKELQKLMGHKDFSTTLRYYDYSGRGIGELGEDVANALAVSLPDFDNVKNA